MGTHNPTVVDHAIAALTQEFGEPVCRGDCCWWTIARERGRPIRLSIFMDSLPDLAEGWLCDLQDLQTGTQHLSLRQSSDIEMLIARIRGLLAPQTGTYQSLTRNPSPSPLSG